MSMDFGGSRITIGPIEKLIVLAALGAVGTGFWRIYDGMSEKLDTIGLNQVVANEQLRSINAQMPDLSALKQRVAEQGVQIDRNTQDIKELQQTRRLK